jgi:hypothetical protein
MPLGLLPAGERHEAGVRAGPAGIRAGARCRRAAPEGTGFGPSVLWILGVEYAVVTGDPGP